MAGLGGDATKTPWCRLWALWPRTKTSDLLQMRRSVSPWVAQYCEALDLRSRCCLYLGDGAAAGGKEEEKDGRGRTGPSPDDAGVV